jgi:hypothetical protein
MSRRLQGWLGVLGALVVGVGDRPSWGHEPGWGPISPAGTVRLASGLTVHYEYHSNRNELGDVLPAGEVLIARTDPGALLRFDRATLKPTLERSDPVPVTCLGRGEGGAVLAGFADGCIGRVNPANLAITELARLTGKVRWVGVTSAGAGRPGKPRLVAVVEQVKEGKDDQGERFEIPFSIVHDLGASNSYIIEPKGEDLPDLSAMAFLLDRKNRLWLGGDVGEWGGWCSYVDLDAGQAHSVPAAMIKDRGRRPWWRGIHGFTEMRDGQVWAYGGLIHMGGREGFIWRVDSGKAEELYQRHNAPPLPMDRPYLPITQVTEDPRTGAVVVITLSDIFRTDARFARWEKIHELKVRYGWRRPDADGAYYPVRSALPVGEAGRPMGLLLATQFDGLIRLVDGRETSHRPLEAESIERIANSSEGILVFDGTDEGEIWRYREGAWSTVSFGPPDQPHPDAPGPRDPFQEDPRGATCVLIDRDGSIITVSAPSAEHKGTRTTARWRNGQAEVLGREVSTLIPSECFLTPNGQLWNADHRTLRRFIDGRWVEVSPTERPRRLRRADLTGYESQLATVNEAGPPWIVHDQHYQVLLRLAYAPGLKDPRLEVVPSTEGGHDLNVRDAISWTRDALLLATDRGLRTFAIDGGRLATPSLDTGGRLVSRLVRDGRGRLWLGGGGLAVLDTGGRSHHSLDALPMPGRSKIVALAADPGHPDGVIAAVEDRGVVFVRVDGR